MLLVPIKTFKPSSLIPGEKAKEYIKTIEVRARR